MKPYILAGSAVAFAAAAALALSPLLANEEPGFLPYTDPQVVARGEALYAANCASCHGPNREGEANWREPGADGRMRAPPHDETGHTWHHPDPLLFAITKHGTEAVVGGDYRSNMVGFADVLTDEEIVAVLAWIKSTWPPRVIEMHDRLNADAAAFSR